MTCDYEIRPVRLSDAPSLLEIYGHYVRHTIISFEYDVPSLKEWEHRMTEYTSEYPWLVCTYKNEPIGYAYGSKHRARTAYTWSPESTVYLAENFHRKGLARILYEALFDLLSLQGYFNVFAGVGLPNEKSEGFHRSMGFTEIGIFPQVGYKSGGWHSTMWFHRKLADYIPDPPFPKKTAAVVQSDEYKNILANASSKLNSLMINVQ